MQYTPEQIREAADILRAMPNACKNADIVHQEMRLWGDQVEEDERSDMEFAKMRWSYVPSATPWEAMQDSSRRQVIDDLRATRAVYADTKSALERGRA